jgi:hypothetical protein
MLGQAHQVQNAGDLGLCWKGSDQASLVSNPDAILVQNRTYNSINTVLSTLAARNAIFVQNMIKLDHSTQPPGHGS